MLVEPSLQPEALLAGDEPQFELSPVLGSAEQLSPDLRRAATVLVAAGLLAGLGNLAFNVLIARVAGTQGYGIAGLLLALSTVAGFAATGLQYAIARESVTAAANLSTLSRLGFSLASTTPWLAVCVVLCTLSPLIALYLHMASTIPVLLADMVFAAALLNAVPLGLLLGAHAYGTIAAAGISQLVSRLLIGVALVRVMDSTDAALVATLGSVLLSTAAMLAVLVKRRCPGIGSPSRSAALRLAAEGAKGALACAALWVVWTMPLLFARHSLTSDAAGDFAAGQLLASGILFVTAPLVTAFFPSLASRHSGSLAWTGFAATVAVAAAAAVALVVVAPFMIRQLYGMQFATPRSLLIAQSLSAMAGACGSYILWHERARGSGLRPVTAALSTAVVVELLAGTLLNASATNLALGPALSILISGGVWYRMQRAAAA